MRGKKTKKIITNFLHTFDTTAIDVYTLIVSDSSAEASVLASGARGRRFKSALSDSFIFVKFFHFFYLSLLYC